jgi:GTPase SAR1 family protein
VDGFVLVYSVVNKKSLGVVRVINDKILDACGTEKVARVLVGNKSDMHGSKREVTKEEGVTLAKEMGNVAFLECSAKKNENVEAVFRAILDEIEKVTAPPPGVKPRSAVGEDEGFCALL